MTPEEITKLAEEYAEDATTADASDPNLSASDLNGIKRDLAEYTEEVIRFILRTHCIVSKEKVINRYNMAKSNIKPQYPEACQYEVGATQVIESLFDPDTINETDK